MERISFKDAPVGLYDAMQQMESFVKDSTLDSQFLSLMNYRISQINGCAYCLDMHFKEAKNAGETDLRLSSVSAWRETPYFTEKERAALAYAEAVTELSQYGVSDEVFDALEPHFTKNEVAALTLAIVKINGWNRLMASFRITPGLYKVGMYA